MRSIIHSQAIDIPHNMTTTAFDIPGCRIVANLGVVRGVVVRSRSLVGTIGAGQPVSVPSLKNFRRSPRAVIELPVVVCSSFEQFYSVDFYNDSKPELVKDNFQLEVRYAYIDRYQNQRDDYFLLDFVEFNQLDKFTKAIDEDAKVAAFLVAPD